MQFRNILDASEHRPKENQRTEPRKHTKDPPLATLVFQLRFFSALKEFFRNFFDCTRESPLQCLNILQQNGC